MRPRAHSLEAARAWAVGDGSALAGLGLAPRPRGQASRARERRRPAGTRSRCRVASASPGSPGSPPAIDGHLKADPTVHDTMAWLVRAIVLWPHEAIAYSKLPELTFRFRWESGRLRFYDLRPERFGLTDIRRDPLWAPRRGHRAPRLDPGRWGADRDRPDVRGRGPRVTLRATASFDDAGRLFWATTYTFEPVFFESFLLPRLGEPPLNATVLADAYRYADALQDLSTTPHGDRRAPTATTSFVGSP